MRQRGRERRDETGKKSGCKRIPLVPCGVQVGGCRLEEREETMSDEVDKVRVSSDLKMGRWSNKAVGGGLGWMV